MPTEPCARLGGLWATDLREVTDDLSVLDGRGRWAVVLPYAGPATLARFDRWELTGPPHVLGTWRGPAASTWRSSMDRTTYIDAVERTRMTIAAGTVYQVNVCRVLSAPVPDEAAADVAALDALLRSGNPAPYGGFVHLPAHDVAIATASPELFLRIEQTPTGREVTTGPIKGTGRTAADLSAKDRAENVMIVDLMRNDLSQVSEPGSVRVPSLLRVEEHPGLVHLVSDVRGTLRAGCTWPELVAATFPPGSVTGAPKLSAVRQIEQLEPMARGPYCGAIGWADADTGEAELAVAIRTFWLVDGEIRFGTGAGITWGSDASAEWAETELKAARLVEVAGGRWPVPEERSAG